MEEEKEEKKIEEKEDAQNLKTEEVRIKEIEEKLDECQAQKKEYLAGWQRAQADFLNYKKEEMERIKTLLKYGNEELILKILPILDNFEIAKKKLSEDLKNNEEIKGILQIKNQILDLLKNQGVEEIEIKIGERFDPNFMEAVEDTFAEDLTRAEVEINNKESGIILEEIQKGYKINGKLLRPVRVKVSLPR